MQKRLLLLSFIEGAAVMAAELCGAKLLAPVFGSSLYVWASVMGVTLSALAAGYFFGGSISTRFGKHAQNLSRILNTAALFLILMPVLSHYVVPRISYLPFLPGVVISTFLLLFPPVFFLGATSPLFILLQTTHTERSGRVSGTVYAVSTAGGILATFLSGFWLIPQIGLSACLFCSGGLLFLVNLLIFRSFKPLQFFLFAGFAYLNFQFITAGDDTMMASDSVLGHLEVKDLRGQDGRAYRILTINEIIQTEMDLETRRSRSEYVNMVDSIVRRAPVQKEALVLGLGGGLTANLLAEKNYRTDGVELDKRIIEAAKQFFFLDSRVSTFYEDARWFLNRCNTRYAVVLVDIFKGEEQPSHIMTRESLKKLKQQLADTALLLINWHGYTQSDKGTGTAIVCNTLKEAGFDVKLCSYSSEESYRNILFVAALQPLPALPFELQEALPATSLINTDDRPLLETYNAQANKAWRLSYLRYYQNRN